MLTADKEVLKNLTFGVVREYIEAYARGAPRLRRLLDYYLGKHEILNRKKDSDVPNNRVICNHAKTITDTSTGYFAGNPISYNGTNADRLKEWFRIADIDTVDLALAKDMGIFGKAYELVNMSDAETPTPKSYELDVMQSFVVYDNTVERRELFGVYCVPSLRADGTVEKHYMHVYTPEKEIQMITNASLTAAVSTVERDNPFHEVPIIEYSNNGEQQGDFEQVIPLIDAYNLLMSDRINDKEQFVDAILLIINAIMGDDDEESNEAYKALKQNKLLELPGESDARYLTRTFDESGVEILRKALEQDIHKFANIPCLTDENFAGNSSGVAMEYKLLGIEMITKIKERNFKAGLKKRIRLYNTINGMKGGVADVEIEPVFSRGLPKNLVELSQIVAQLSEYVPLEQLLSLLPFVKDPKAAIKLLEQQKQKALEEQQKAFGMTANEPPDGEDDEE